MDGWADAEPEAVELYEWIEDWLPELESNEPETRKTVNRPIEDGIAGFGIKRLVQVTAGGRTVTATAGHPFWVESRA